MRCIRISNIEFRSFVHMLELICGYTEWEVQIDVAPHQHLASKHSARRGNVFIWYAFASWLKGAFCAQFGAARTAVVGAAIPPTCPQLVPLRPSQVDPADCRVSWIYALKQPDRKLPKRVLRQSNSAEESTSFTAPIERPQVSKRREKPRHWCDRSLAPQESCGPNSHTSVSSGGCGGTGVRAGRENPSKAR